MNGADMTHSRAASAIVVVLLWSFPVAQAAHRQRSGAAFDPMRDTLARSEPQPIYAADPDDAWNQVFFLLFTRTVSSRLMADGALPFSAADERLVLSDRRVTRIESGDRAIDPLYPSWLWMGSLYFDFQPDRAWRILSDPWYSRLVTALETVRRTATSRPPLARALMQADVWSAYDMLHTMTRLRAGFPNRGFPERDQRAEALLPLLARTLRALALSSDEIARLPDTYSAAAAALGLPDLFGTEAGWMEIRWFPRRSHDEASGYRRATRVFFRPTVQPNDEAAFLNVLRDAEGANSGALASVALLTQLLVVGADGTAVSSPITYQVQFRGTAARSRGSEIPQYELSRRLLLSSPATGGLVGFDASSPAYLPMAGNDFSFATPPRLDGEAVLAPLGTVCAGCHGGPGVGHLKTFSIITAPGLPVPPVDRLVSAQNVHAGDVARRKMDTEEFKALRQHWQ